MTVPYIEYFGLFAAATAFEFSYVAWARTAALGRPGNTAVWSVITGALGLIGISGALGLYLGEIPYLAGLGLGAYSSAWLGRPDRARSDT